MGSKKIDSTEFLVRFQMKTSQTLAPKNVEHAHPNIVKCILKKDKEYNHDTYDKKKHVELKSK